MSAKVSPGGATFARAYNDEECRPGKRQRHPARNAATLLISVQRNNACKA